MAGLGDVKLGQRILVYAADPIAILGEKWGRDLRCAHDQYAAGPSGVLPFRLRKHGEGYGSPPHFEPGTLVGFWRGVRPANRLLLRLPVHVALRVLA